MDDLTASLAGSFTLSSYPNDTASPHPHFSLYKLKTTSLDQEDRRRKELERQKERRFDSLSHIRKLVDGEESDIQYGIDKSMRQRSSYIKDKLMYSEWLVEVPPDIQTEWIMVMCPVGKRSLVIASKGSTKAYSKAGYLLNEFNSYLPGGLRHKSTKHDQTTILDCIFNEVTRTFYVLDIMCWNGHPVYDCETEFRFFWLLSKLGEEPGLSKMCKENPYRYIALPQIPCYQQSMAEAVAVPMDVELDGVLFFHKRTHYTLGSTPLVVWLKPYMLTEIMGIPIPLHMMGKKPNNYVNYAKHMEDVEKTKEKDTQRKEEWEQKRKEEREQKRKEDKEQKLKEGAGQKQKESKDKDKKKVILGRGNAPGSYPGNKPQNTGTASSDAPEAMEVTKSKSRRRRGKGKKKEVMDTEDTGSTVNTGTGSMDSKPCNTGVESMTVEVKDSQSPTTDKNHT